MHQAQRANLQVVAEEIILQNQHLNQKADKSFSVARFILCHGYLFYNQYFYKLTIHHRLLFIISKTYI
jgi:hypothetical protein